MKNLSILFILCFTCFATRAQFVYKLKADSVKITRDSDSCSAELILENSTKNINGFLYNKGRGRTEFRKALNKINDSLYIIGGDTLNLYTSSIPISTLTAAQRANTINNGNYTQEWRWDSLSNSGLKLSSVSTAAISNSQKLLELDLSGTTTNSGQTTYALYVKNAHPNSTMGVWNVGGYFETIYAGSHGRSIWAKADRGTAGYFESMGGGAGLVSESHGGFAGSFEAIGDSSTADNSSLFVTATGATTKNTGIIIDAYGSEKNYALLARKGLSGFLSTNDSVTAIVHIGGSDTSRSALRIESGTAPISPNNGDIWHASNHLYARLNGSTVQLDGQTSAWNINGNTGTSPATNFLGTTDSNSLVFKTFNQQRASILTNGIINFGPNDTASRPPFRFYPNADFLVNARRNYNDSSTLYKNGLRYHGRLGYLEIGTSNFIDTTISEQNGQYQTSALILNTDSPNHLNGPVQNSILATYNVQLPSNKSIGASILAGGSYFLSGSLAHVVGGGVFHTISGDINGSLIMGNSQQIAFRDDNSAWLGYDNTNHARTVGNITGGLVNSIGSVSQLTVGSYLVNRSYAATALGNGNVDFSSLPYNDFDSIYASNVQNIDSNYLLLSIGNSKSKNATTRSNALSILYNGRTQINTTGYSNNLSQSDVTPKAALEIVSTTSGVLLPKLTTSQRNSIAGGDLYNGLLLYNTDDSKFQFYNGTYWKSICDSCSSGGNDWSLTGNSGTSPSTNFLGTTDAQRLVFRTKNTEWATIDTLGRVGIGTSTPADLLTVLKASTGITSDSKAISSSTQGATFNTTSGALTSYGGYFNTNSTRASGSNSLTNVGLFATASGAQVNYALKTDGNVNMANLPTTTDTTSYKPLGINSTGDVAKVTGWPPAVNYSVQSLTDGSTITWNATNGINAVVTLGGTGRTLSITNPVAGMTYTIRIIQDGTGSRTITTWPTNSKWPSGTTPTLSTVAGRYDIVCLYYDGTNYYGTYQQNFQ